LKNVNKKPYNALVQQNLNALYVEKLIGVVWNYIIKTSAQP